MYIPLKDANGGGYNADVIMRDESGTNVVMQTVVPVDPVTGVPNASTEATLQALNTLNDTMLFYLSAMLEKMPRLDRYDRVSAQVSDSSGNELNSAYFGISSNHVGNNNNGFMMYRMFEPWNFSNAGSAYLYNQITVS